MRGRRCNTENEGVLGRQLAWLDGLVHAKRPYRLPLVLGRTEVAAVLENMTGVERLAASLMYGAGPR